MFHTRSMLRRILVLWINLKLPNKKNAYNVCSVKYKKVENVTRCVCLFAAGILIYTKHRNITDIHSQFPKTMFKKTLITHLAR